MSGVWKGLVSGTKDLARTASGGLLYAKKPPAPPKPPTVDTARQQVQEADRIQRRRGVLANIFAGSTATGTSTVGKTTLGGQ